VAPILLAGFVLGFGIAALREFLDRGFRTSSQVETALDTNCLALVPARVNAEAKEGWFKPMQEWFGGASHPRPNADKKTVNSKIIDQPFSQFAEAIRSVKLAIDLHGDIASNKVIGLTSSVPDEGKTTISAALAQSIARAGARVILVDCDWHNPSLSREFTPGATPSILHVLANKISLEEAIWKDPSTNLAYLPADATFRTVNSSEILASAATKSLFGRLRQYYDYVIVDLPPLAPLVDVRATTHLIDAYIFVVEWGRTNPSVAQHALSIAPNIRERLLGVVLNKVNMKQLNLYDRNRSAFYSNKSYARYGYTS
jgi:capsular exopolysaccharide synthesis family protein